MKEFIIKNKKTVIVFLCAVVVIIVCGIIGKAVTKDDTDNSISPRGNSSTGDVSAVSYETYDAADISSVSDEADSDVSAVSAVERDVSAQ